MCICYLSSLFCLNCVSLLTYFTLITSVYFLCMSRSFWRIKRNSMQERLVEAYFWRTYDQQEIDLIEVENNQLAAYECKWKIHKHKIPAAFAGAYPEASHQIISQDNYLGFIE